MNVSSCVDTSNGATDEDGDGCDWYVGNRPFCGNHDDPDFDAERMCCSCGGGVGGPGCAANESRTCNVAPCPLKSSNFSASLGGMNGVPARSYEFRTVQLGAIDSAVRTCTSYASSDWPACSYGAKMKRSCSQLGAGWKPVCENRFDCGSDTESSGRAQVPQQCESLAQQLNVGNSLDLCTAALRACNENIGDGACVSCIDAVLAPTTSAPCIALLAADASWLPQAEQRNLLMRSIALASCASSGTCTQAHATEAIRCFTAHFVPATACVGALGSCLQIPACSGLSARASSPQVVSSRRPAPAALALRACERRTATPQQSRHASLPPYVM